ncbi:alpha/beta hydrolase [Nakamurella sp. YIM 132087]|uniref:Alpha/beta hydrolase n=2 Tax=Nakamurella alba TaxID=2665158 RepID=A0A7K1FLR6_9ACTN|nr:alpha/beta hydrolase [Nakamurella alba]
MMVSPTQLSVLRMIPIAGRIRRAGAGRLAVFRLLNSTRGWDTRHTPADDARWAMDRIRERFGNLPIGLVGHSLGGRAALLSAGAPGVRSVVALAPWVYPEDSASAPGRKVLVVHGSADRIADPDRAAAVARNLSRTADVAVIMVEGGSHSMLRHHAVFDGIAADFTASVLLDRPPHEPAVERVLEGETFLQI